MRPTGPRYGVGVVVSVCFVRPGGVVGAWELRLPVVDVVVTVGPAAGCEVSVGGVADGVVMLAWLVWLLVEVVTVGCWFCWFCRSVVVADSDVAGAPGMGSSADGGIGAPDRAAHSNTA